MPTCGSPRVPVPPFRCCSCCVLCTVVSKQEAPGSDAYARLLSMATVPRLSSDVDQEIRVCAITASGLVLAHLGHLMGPQFERVRS